MPLAATLPWSSIRASRRASLRTKRPALNRGGHQPVRGFGPKDFRYRFRGVQSPRVSLARGGNWVAAIAVIAKSAICRKWRQGYGTLEASLAGNEISSNGKR